jgi:hypothetical protein
VITEMFGSGLEFSFGGLCSGVEIHRLIDVGPESSSGRVRLLLGKEIVLLQRIGRHIE